MTNITESIARLQDAKALEDFIDKCKFAICHDYSGHKDVLDITICGQSLQFNSEFNSADRTMVKDLVTKINLTINESIKDLIYNRVEGSKKLLT